MKWVAGKVGVPKEKLHGITTFEAEELVIEAWWDDVPIGPRQDLLKTLPKDQLRVATISGGTMLAVLNASVHSQGFAFYTAMSSAICNAAGAFGVILPFKVYIMASITVAGLTSPAGIAAMVAGLAGGAMLMGRADWKTTASFVIVMHQMKVEALR